MLGGLWMVKIGINRALWLFGVVQVVSIFGFAWLASVGHHAEITSVELAQLAIVIGLEALGVGLGTVAFVAFIARTTHPAYTATQFALFTSLMAVPRTFANAATGWMVEAMGWTEFFLLCAVLAIPGMLLLLKVAPWGEKITIPFNEKDERGRKLTAWPKAPKSLRELIYLAEAVFVVLPSSLFLLFTFPWLIAGPSLKAWGPSLVVLTLWLGGLVGIIALFQMFVRLNLNKKTTINFLYAKLLIGMLSAIYPILMIYNAPPDGGKRAGFLLFLIPVAVGLHWVWVLKAAEAKARS